MSPMLDCDAVMRQLWDDLDGELTAERMEAIREHVAMCARCYPQYNFEREFLTSLSRLRREHSNPAALRERLMDALERSGCSGTLHWYQRCCRCTIRMQRPPRRSRVSGCPLAASVRAFRTSYRAASVSALHSRVRSPAELHEAFENARREFPVTMLLVTHDISEAARLANEIAVMRAGRIGQQGPIAELYNSPATGYVAALIQHALATSAQMREV